MQILFIGQKGLPVLCKGLATAREQRVETLAKELSQAGHKVAVTCAKPFSSPNIAHYNGIELLHKFSLHPQKEGGWIHLLLTCLTVWRRQPDVVHAHGWKTAVLVRFMALLSPETTYIWTIDNLPKKHLFQAKIIAWQAKYAFDAVSVPTRQLQYMLLHFLNLRTTYIPDGYTLSSLPDAPVSRFGLRKNQYCMTTATDLSELRSIAKAYAQAKTKKKLVLIAEQSPSLKRLLRQFPFLHPINILPGRGLHSLIRQTSLVIHTDLSHGPETTLQAMDGGRAIIATTQPVLEETLGTSAVIVRPNDINGLKTAIDELSTDTKKQVLWGKQAQKRAKAHFSWPRLLEDYLTLYHYPVIRRVPVDSLIKKSLLSKTA